MSIPPLFPSLSPSLVNPLWFNVDCPCDDEAEIANFELEHQAWLNSLGKINFDTIPIGKTAAEHLSEEADTDDEDGNDDSDDTESHDDEDEEDLDLEVPVREYSPGEGPRGQPQNIVAHNAVR